MKFGTCLQNNCSFDVLIYELNSSHVVVIVALIFNFAYDTLIFSIFFSFFPAINLIIFYLIKILFILKDFFSFHTMFLTRINYIIKLSLTGITLWLRLMLKSKGNDWSIVRFNLNSACSFLFQRNYYSKANFRRIATRLNCVLILSLRLFWAMHFSNSQMLLFSVLSLFKTHYMRCYQQNFDRKKKINYFSKIESEQKQLWKVNLRTWTSFFAW